MTKHGRNSTANPVYSNFERKRDSKQSGFGTISKRMSRESARPLNYCALTNQSCIHPVITPEGYVYDKEAIISYILKKKDDYKSQLKLYRESLKIRESESEQKKILENEEKINQFKKCEAITVSSKSVGKAQKTSLKDPKKNLTCYWIPSLAPVASEVNLKPPSNVVYCPFSGKPLKLSDMIEVKFLKSKDDHKSFVCSATGDVITNSTPCVVLKTTGGVVTKQYVNEAIKKPGELYMKCPFTGRDLADSDIIDLKCGGSGFAGHSEPIVATIITPAMLIS